MTLTESYSYRRLVLAAKWLRRIQASSRTCSKRLRAREDVEYADLLEVVEAAGTLAAAMARLLGPAQDDNLPQQKPAYDVTAPAPRPPPKDTARPVYAQRAWPRTGPVQ